MHHPTPAFKHNHIALAQLFTPAGLERPVERHLTALHHEFGLAPTFYPTLELEPVLQIYGVFLLPRKFVAVHPFILTRSREDMARAWDCAALRTVF